jgi:ELWxxDGT repeat protein
VLAPANQIGATPFPLPATRTYFAGDDPGQGRQLWQADETVTLTPGTAGTVGFDVDGLWLVDDINPAGADPQDLTSVGGTPVFGTATGATEVFSANDGTHGRELWYSDGWSSNTHLAADINPGPAGSDPQDITALGQVAYLTAYDPAHGRELWKLTVPPSPQLFLLGPLTTVTAGSPVTVTVTLQPAPGARQPTGSVTFYQDGTSIGTSPLVRHRSGGPTASITLAAPSTTSQIVAVYSGDARYLPATSNTATVTGN